MPRVGPVELLIVLLIVIMIFGVGKLPELGSALGKSIREFRKATSSGNSSEEETKSETD